MSGENSLDPGEESGRASGPKLKFAHDLTKKGLTKAERKKVTETTTKGNK